jgi:hypothetical protein
MPDQINDETKPSSKKVQDFHTNSDADGSRNSFHHTLGVGRGQASPGDHLHDGGSSKLLMEGDVLTGAKGGNVALANLISLLSTRFGFTDNTT